MMDFEERADALSGRKRAGIFAVIARLVGFAMLALLLVLTVFVLL